ncbi:MAG TPA: hypothetical protein DDZ51_04395 [Planctomycetaceae bacterium]|nr:hypothetical protein [Planctomycetaceae bacterium]
MATFVPSGAVLFFSASAARLGDSALPLQIVLFCQVRSASTPVHISLPLGGSSMFSDDCFIELHHEKITPDA